MGKTKPEDWINYYSDKLNCQGIEVYVDISQYGLEKEPVIITSLHGDSDHWILTGGSSPYNITTKGFKIYIPNITCADALMFNYRIHYIGFCV